MSDSFLWLKPVCFNISIAPPLMAGQFNKILIGFSHKKYKYLVLTFYIFESIEKQGKTPVSFGLALVLFWSSFAHALLIPKQTKRKPKEDKKERRTRPKQERNQIALKLPPDGHCH